MPLYEYDCEACHQTVELLVRNQSEKPVCPVCGAERLTKVLSVPANPAVRGGASLPVARGETSGPSCGAPRCCGGGCQF